MDTHRPEPAAFTVREDAGDLIVGCQYWEVRHAASAGGGIASIVFRHGSGRNILSAPCETRLGTFRDLAFASYSAGQPKATSRLAHTENADGVCVETVNPLAAPDGAQLPALCRHRYEYHAWGYIRQRVTIECAEPIPGVWQLLVARLAVAPHLNEFAVRPAPALDPDWRLIGNVERWFELDSGQAAADLMAIRTAVMPLHFTFLQRGVEGFDWFLADDLDQWHQQVFGQPKRNHFLVRYAPELNGYEVRTAALECHPRTVTLRDTYAFDFFMGLPFVRERVPPLVFSIGGLLDRKADGSGTEFPAEPAIANYAEHGISLTRVHNDGPSKDGVFWRGGAYPPYPPARMRAMDRAIADCHRHGIRVTPYFSLCEFHPDVPGFAENAPRWQRTVDDSGEMLHNHTPLGEFGAQMCLAAGWLEFRKQTIDMTLKNHAFDGIYYDWCLAMSCLHPGHRSGSAHWSVEEFIHLLEWSRERVGPGGEIYLHMTNVPFVVAENLATRVLVFESGPPGLTPAMFPPDVTYLKTCSRGVCAVGLAAREPRRFALCCLLNHVTPDVRDPEALEVFRAVTEIDFTRYTQFRGHRNAAVSTRGRGLYSAVYWNDAEALVLLVNLGDKARRGRWRLAPGELGWGRDKAEAAGTIPDNAPETVAPLGFRYVRVGRVRQSPALTRTRTPTRQSHSPSLKPPPTPGTARP